MGRPSQRPPSPPPMGGVPGMGQQPPMFAGGPPGLASGQMIHQSGNPIYQRQPSAEMLYKRQVSGGDTYSTRAQLTAQQALNAQGELENAVYVHQTSLMSAASTSGPSGMSQDSLQPNWVPKSYIE